MSTSRRQESRAVPDRWPVTSTRRIAMAIVALCALLIPTAEVSGQRAGLCLDLQELGLWVPIDSARVEPRFRGPPPADDDYRRAFPARVQLGSEDFFKGISLQLIIPAASQQTPHSWRSWRTSGDTLILHLGNGFGGIAASVVRDASRWRGGLRTESDQEGTLLYERAIVLQESACGSPPRVLASEDGPLPRAVELAGGAALVLGESLPEAVRVEPRLGEALTVMAAVSGRFARPNEVIVSLTRTSRLVHRIELRYPAGFDVEPIALALAAEYGPGRSAIRWENRTTRITVYRGEGEPARVILSDPRIEWAPPL